MGSAVTTEWDEVHSTGTVHPEQLVWHIGAILGTIHVLPGGTLHHRAYAERIQAESGATVLIEGMVEAATPSDVNLLRTGPGKGRLMVWVDGDIPPSR